MRLADFKVIKFLGKGSYGSVFKVVRLSDSTEYAMKEVKIKYMNQIEREEAVNEVRLLASVKHPLVIRYCESFYEADKLYIITDFAENGDLNEEVKKLRTTGRKFEEETLWSYFIQMLIALQAIHRQNILHRDLKCQNIFLSKENRIKIGDLGVAKLLKAGVTKTQVGTPYYISPEIWRKLPYDSKSDVWSLGCVLYELATFRHPFTADSPKALATKIMSGKYLPIPAGYSMELNEVIRSMLVVEANRRPSVGQILESSSVQKRLHLLPSDILDYYTNHQQKTKDPSPVINTIKVPRNLLMLKENLPAPSYPNPRKLFDSPIKAPERVSKSEDRNIPSARLNVVNKPEVIKPQVDAKVPVLQAYRPPVPVPVPINPRMLVYNPRPKSSPVSKPKISPKKFNIASPSKHNIRPHSSPVKQKIVAVEKRPSVAAIPSRPVPLNPHRPTALQQPPITKPSHVNDKIPLKPNQIIQKPAQLPQQKPSVQINPRPQQLLAKPPVVSNPKLIPASKPNLIAHKENVLNNVPVRQPAAGILKKASPPKVVNKMNAVPVKRPIISQLYNANYPIQCKF